MYKHQETDEALFSLHDCVANRIKFKDGMISFYFPEGIWITKEHADNDTGNTVRSDAAKVRFELFYPDDDAEVYVYKPKGPDKAIRKEWKLKKLIQRVNDGEYQLEFLYQYSNGIGRFIECELKTKEKPYHWECNIKMLVKEATYLWNDIRPDATW